ncbi:undecaprenyldiphospho-muramoylpentapeptide beta-N-acetylglucosaminyltransferase [Clostridium thermobutyricum]|uniref:UDP-N-acetylglucosamine--N-acetylmuramyl-(pentapeptide) pyrophosphoryl-undecaprenol N-acetylglucosamine transferase n=1 Tax=Clostridium thermobutyricum TaxID=29372 RepID=N9XRI5_9CLOT|nr:undecaprenyldiphospho-muramoylpentapeptide beta-N-acetylglucosaminyltransferase [Clostridium thermobutyricum]ENZ02303.1 undecaprenyldiphospho-muramoylpentapeptide beta-N-acetylglucosaminyltransferase [Clostridium thermobutyricum]
MSKYKIIMTGGGTAGHVTPNLALVPALKELDFEIKYIGSKDGMEKDIIKKEGIPYYGISSGKLRRYFDIKNFTDPFKVAKGVAQALRILGKEKPDIIFSKGGFVTVPVVIAASIKKIPVIAHESDMTPGLANKLASPFCDKLCVTFRESLKHVKNNKGILTGSPIRREILKGSKILGKEACGFKDDKDIILAMGGSLGAKVINDGIRENLQELLKDNNIIHICGKGNLDKNLEGINGYKQFEYVREELPNLMQAADYIISRAGANSIFEFLALRKPTLLIPLSRNQSRGDQILNANSFKKEGFALAVEEEELAQTGLVKNVLMLKNSKQNLIDSMNKSNMNDGVKEIIRVITSTIESKRK